MTGFSIGSAYAEEGKMLTGADLKKMLSKELYTAGWSIRGYRFMDHHTPDGGFRSLVFAPADGLEIQTTGTWQVEGDEVCFKIRDRKIGTDLPPTVMTHHCYQWRQNGERFKVTAAGGAGEGYFYVLGD